MLGTRNIRQGKTSVRAFPNSIQLVEDFLSGDSRMSSLLHVGTLVLFPRLTLVVP